MAKKSALGAKFSQCNYCRPSTGVSPFQGLLPFAALILVVKAVETWAHAVALSAHFLSLSALGSHLLVVTCLGRYVAPTPAGAGPPGGSPVEGAAREPVLSPPCSAHATAPFGRSMSAWRAGAR